jgi:hypothetical protein
MRQFAHELLKFLQKALFVRATILANYNFNCEVVANLNKLTNLRAESVSERNFHKLFLKARPFSCDG